MVLVISSEPPRTSTGPPRKNAAFQILVNHLSIYPQSYQVQVFSLSEYIPHNLTLLAGVL